jgi:hypothetical protein
VQAALAKRDLEIASKLKKLMPEILRLQLDSARRTVWVNIRLRLNYVEGTMVYPFGGSVAPFHSFAGVEPPEVSFSHDYRACTTWGVGLPYMTGPMATQSEAATFVEFRSRCRMIRAF